MEMKYTDPTNDDQEKHWIADDEDRKLGTFSSRLWRLKIAIASRLWGKFDNDEDAAGNKTVAPDLAVWRGEQKSTGGRGGA